VIRTREELETESRYPFYLKANYTTASKAVWRISNSEELRSKGAELSGQGRLDGSEEFVVQECAEGALERVLAVFNRGELTGIHCHRQLLPGLGGGDTAKLGVSRPVVCRHVERLGAELRWHGAQSMDYVLPETEDTPLFIDANPRLVEPMNAVLSGINLADMLVRISTGQSAMPGSCGATQVRTHLLLQALLSAADSRKRRLDVARAFFRVLAGRGVYARSREELLPIRDDFQCLIPLMYATVRLFIRPNSSSSLSAGSIASYSLSETAAKQIADLSIPWRHRPSGSA
jgi:biotin carboxylase